MSETHIEIEEVMLPHDKYIEEHDVDLSKLPDNIKNSLSDIGDLIDKYEGEPTDALRSEIESKSESAKNDMAAWLSKKDEVKVEPKTEVKTEPTVAAKTETVVEPKKEEKKEEAKEDDSWGLGFLKSW